MTDYTTKLRDPRWKSKRKEILDRDGHECVDCQERTHLEVHHLWYEHGKEPWECPDEALIVLCDICHKEETRLLKTGASSLVYELRKRGRGKDMYHLSSVMRGIPLGREGRNVLLMLIMVMLDKGFRNVIISIRDLCLGLPERKGD
jgi:hypothetical protein